MTFLELRERVLRLIQSPISDAEAADALDDISISTVKLMIDHAKRGTRGIDPRLADWEPVAGPMENRRQLLHFARTFMPHNHDEFGDIVYKKDDSFTPSIVKADGRVIQLKGNLWMGVQDYDRWRQRAELYADGLQQLAETVGESDVPPTGNGGSTGALRTEENGTIAPPNLFWWDSIPHSLPPRLWQLLDYMNDEQSVAVDEIFHKVYDGSTEQEQTVRSDISKLNNKLLEISDDALKEYKLAYKQGYVTRA